MNDSWKRRFDLFVSYQESLNNVSPKTVQWYRQAWRRFEKAFEYPIKTDRELKEVIELEVIRQRHQIPEKNRISDVSLNNYIRAFNSWLSSMYEDGYTQSKIRVKLIKTGKKVRKTTSQATVNTLIMFAPKTKTQIRTQHMIAVAVDAGLRKTEIAELRVSDVLIGSDGSYLRIRKGKGRKERIVAMSVKLARRLHKYISKAEKADEDYLFSTRTGTRVSDRNMHDELKEFAIAAGVQEQVGWHLFRHTMATHYLSEGGDVVHLRRQLGHTNIATTMIYEHLKPEDLSRAKAGITML